MELSFAMRLLKSTLSLTLLLLLITGCSTRGNPTYTKRTKAKASKEIKQQALSSNQNYISRLLYKEYASWHRTPYKYGGEDLNGIDCSSFIQKIYMDAFGIKLPRTTLDQVKKGIKVSKNNYKDGDLIFFKTGYNTRHTGIIIEKGKFIHASQKRGVSISDIHNPYWKSKFWQIRRILP